MYIVFITISNVIFYVFQIYHTNKIEFSNAIGKLAIKLLLPYLHCFTVNQLAAV